jgi:hypothetical protein
MLSCVARRRLAAAAATAPARAVAGARHTAAATWRPAAARSSALYTLAPGEVDVWWLHSSEVRAAVRQAAIGPRTVKAAVCMHACGQHTL